jgi:hypothetical protein
MFNLIWLISYKYIFFFKEKSSISGSLGYNLTFFFLVALQVI